MASEKSEQERIALQRTKQVFRFLKAFAQRREPIPHSLAEQHWSLRLRELPRHPSIAVGAVELRNSTSRRETDEAELQEESPTEPLIRVRRPTLTPPPRPPREITDWVVSGWDRTDGRPDVLPTRNRKFGDRTVTEAFKDERSRVVALDAWRHAWNRWEEAERPAREAQRIFERLYELHGRIELESERVELILGDGRLRWLVEEGGIDNPILLQRVELVFDASVPEFRVIDSDREPELGGPLLQAGKSLSGEKLNELREELEAGGFHPLERAATNGYLARLAALLGPKGEFRETAVEADMAPDPVVSRDPALYLRARMAGFVAAFDRVLEDLDRSPDLPPSLVRVVGVESPLREGSSSVPEFVPGSDQPDVLLSKLANREQTEIVRTLERHRAVLVQGPPGTGKSHTIANLIGHLVANGKRVLVTSHTTKALRVLRDHVVGPLRPLCVALLDNDLAGRAQLESAVRGIVTRLSTSTEAKLLADIERLERARETLLDEVANFTRRLEAVRRSEYEPVRIAGESLDASEAARVIARTNAGNDWLPGEVESGAPIPLSDGEIEELYATNEQLTTAEEQEIQRDLPSIDALLNKDAMSAAVSAVAEIPEHEETERWGPRSNAATLSIHERVLRCLHELSRDTSLLLGWQRAVVAAGHTGGSAAEIWRALTNEIRNTVDVSERSRLQLLENPVEIVSGHGVVDLHATIQEIRSHLSNDRSLSSFALLLHPSWKRVITSIRVGGRAPATRLAFDAIAAHLAVADAWRRFGARWSLQAEPIGLPSLRDMPQPREPVLSDYATTIGRLLDWWSEKWSPVEKDLSALDFDWAEFRAGVIARRAPATPFDHDVEIVEGELAIAVRARLTRLAGFEAERRLRALEEHLSPFQGRVVETLRDAVRHRDPATYGRAFDGVCALVRKREVVAVRTRLLAKLERSAPGWARAIRQRDGVHGDSRIPGDARAAWRWRQIFEELERRASLDEVELMRRLEGRGGEFRQATVDLIDRKAWLAQIRRTDLAAKQALNGWADTQKKIGKGTGKRVPELQARARELLTKAREAVPVWIMPLARVAESFDPVRGKFDVVIVDEASQCDVTGLLAWYLGREVAIVGDHEQVSPSDIGRTIEETRALIGQHLVGIPNGHLYDGQTSIYDLARHSFGGEIALCEHFRCVPDIIEFSNHLSYGGQIRPLRNPFMAKRPHVVEFVVPSDLGAARAGKVNEAEARWIAALIAAANECPEYAGKTFGAITLLGDEQAKRIHDLAVGLVGAVDLEGRRFVAGNSAQFQGDERDIVWLSMVDAPDGGVLRFSDRLPTKQRYNVATSRAKDQLWLVHSLDPNRDLQAGDLRRRLIEHVRDPGAQRRAMEGATRRAESPFEKEVITRLVAAGFRVQSQVEVGHYRIDLVVSEGPRQLAVECDGDRFHPLETIADDMRRQADLERCGWRFIRVRGTRFFRDPSGTISGVIEELGRRGVRPVGVEPSADESGKDDGRALKEALIRRAWEILREHGWLSASSANEHADEPEPVTEVSQ